MRTSLVCWQRCIRGTIGRFLMRAVAEELRACPEAADLYNVTFKQELGLWTSLALTCDGGRLKWRHKR